MYYTLLLFPLDHYYYSYYNYNSYYLLDHLDVLKIVISGCNSKKYNIRRLILSHLPVTNVNH